MHSLHSRLLLAASLVLAGFIGATGLALDKAFHVSAEAAMSCWMASFSCITSRSLLPSTLAPS